MTDPDSMTKTATPATLRSEVRAAVGRAWDRAVAAGALPVWPDDAVRPAIEIERPADAGPRRLRQQPRDEARPAVSHGAARHRRGAGGGDGRGSRGRPGRHAGRRGRGRATRLPQPAPSRRRPRVDDRRRSSPTRRAWGTVAGRAVARSVNVEFVSANPTGPLHVGNARGAFIGDMLSRVLEAGGQRVTREYYFNDSGGQIRNLGASLAAHQARRTRP